ncbi:hypothetical protein B296_00042011 [Ensete ventricosum]|uniref:Uncharacterized protein n=1 Tax=Ensete ventricosum TaxID=4639 RepID=A0A426ZB91_ENSVE|nr:hypothetical protein B296_00042011 [Ensete ventricosum]
MQHALYRPPWTRLLRRTQLRPKLRQKPSSHPKRFPHAYLTIASTVAASPAPKSTAVRPSPWLTTQRSP